MQRGSPVAQPRGQVPGARGRLGGGAAAVSSTVCLDEVRRAHRRALRREATTLYLNNGRYQVRTQWFTRDGATGSGQTINLTTDTGAFWFFNSANVEMVIEVLNGYGLNSRYWAFVGGLTDVNVIMTVTDSQTGTVKTYTNPQGTAFQPIRDTSAFATCP